VVNYKVIKDRLYKIPESATTGVGMVKVPANEAKGELLRQIFGHMGVPRGRQQVTVNHATVTV
jgi:hypothetical protein